MRNVLDVPSYRQPVKSKYCGPVSLQMILAYKGVNISLPHLREEFVTRPNLEQNGVSPEHIMDASERMGFYALEYSNYSFEDFISEIDGGNPLIALLRPPTKPRGLHYIVVKGYDINERTLIVNDPADWRRKKFDYSYFRKLSRIQREDFLTQNFGLVLEPIEKLSS